jgi:histidinol phosphatase-like enzyme
LLEAYILDPSISLANHIKIGDKKQDLEIYYHRNIKSKTIFIIDESEFTEIKIHLKEQKIVKITFICYEIENQLGLL